MVDNPQTHSHLVHLDFVQYGDNAKKTGGSHCIKEKDLAQNQAVHQSRMGGQENSCETKREGNR